MLQCKVVQNLQITKTVLWCGAKWPLVKSGTFGQLWSNYRLKRFL
jgi:hypothetical protein